MLKADLHIHSIASDGRHSPSEVLEMAHEAGLGLVSITDHDTVGGLEEASQAASRLGIQFVPGCEVSSTSTGQEVHLLAYGIDPSNAALDSFFTLQQTRRNDRAVEFLARLQKTGDLPASATLPEPELGRSIARPHIAKLLVDAGTASDFADAFRRYLTPGCTHFVPKPLPEGLDVIEVVHAAGGVVVLAHPGHGARHTMVLDLIRNGLDGIEVVHPAHDGSLEVYYRELAMRYGLFVTGGSDFHGNPKHGSSNLGEYWIKPDAKIMGMVWG